MAACSHQVVYRCKQQLLLLTLNMNKQETYQNGRICTRRPGRRNICLDSTSLSNCRKVGDTGRKFSYRLVYLDPILQLGANLVFRPYPQELFLDSHHDLGSQDPVERSAHANPIETPRNPPLPAQGSAAGFKPFQDNLIGYNLTPRSAAITGKGIC